MSPTIPRIGVSPLCPALGSPTTGCLRDEQAGLEFVPSRSQAPGGSGACTRACLELLQGMQQKETGAGSLSRVPCPSWLPASGDMGNQRRETGQGLSRPLFVGTAPQEAEPALCPPKRTFASHRSFDLPKTACLFPSTLLHLRASLSTRVQRSEQGLACTGLWPSHSLIPCLQGEGSREMPAAARVQGKYRLRAGAAPSRTR